MMHTLGVGVILLMLGMGAAVLAQATSNDITFDSFDLPMARWGTQQGVIEVTNNADYLKFLIVETDLTFEGEYLNPERLQKFNYILPPGERRTVTFEIAVPGNFGKGVLNVTVHDVVDTLDDILPGQKVFSQTEQIRFKPESVMIPYLQERLTVPPRVEKSLDFDFEFSRLLVLLLSEQKTPEEIASMADVDVAYVHTVIDSMVARKYLFQSPDGPAATFPIVRVEQAKLFKPLADEYTATLASVITRNLSTYSETLNGMVADGKLSADSNEILDGGTILYQRYPTVGGLLLWYDLGQEFVSDPRALAIFDGSDPCNAHIPRYMYMVQGGPLFNGTHYYNLQIGPRKLTVNWSNEEPDLECVTGYYKKYGALQDRRDWQYPPEQAPEVHVFDTNRVYIGLRHLRKGTDAVIADLSVRFGAVAEDAGLNPNQLGLRYWFWNLLATRTLAVLTEQGAVVNTGNGFYRFEGR